MNCKHFLESQHLWQRFSKDFSSNWFFKLNNTVSSIFMIFKGCIRFMEAKAHISIIKRKRNGWILSYLLFFFVSILCLFFIEDRFFSDKIPPDHSFLSLHSSQFLNTFSLPQIHSTFNS